MDYFYKQLLFVVVAITVLAVVIPAEVRNILGTFAIGWVLADFARVLFPRKDV